MEHEGTGTAGPQPVPLRCQKVALRIGREQLALFFPLLQRGVTVQAELGRSLRELLCDQFRIPEEYVAGRITTIFVDNRPVDDLDGTIIREGSRVTLSAAMPGLVGATMRRSGFYAALRQGISHAEAESPHSVGQGTVKLKLFNLLLPELSPLILARGVLLQREELEHLVQELGSGSRLGLASTYPCQREECGGTLVTASIRDGEKGVSW